MTFRIAETSTSTFHYHLVQEKTDALRQGSLESICGKKFLGWETLIPVRVWGLQDHLPSSWCAECTEAKSCQGRECEC